MDFKDYMRIVIPIIILIGILIGIVNGIIANNFIMVGVCGVMLIAIIAFTLWVISGITVG